MTKQQLEKFKDHLIKRVESGEMSAEDAFDAYEEEAFRCE